MMPFRTDIGRLAADGSAPLARTDADGRVIWRNRVFRDLMEGDGPSRLGRPLREMVEPADRGIVEAAVTGLSGGAIHADAHVRVRRADGTWSDGVLRFRRTPRFEDRPEFLTVLLRLA